MKLTGVRFNAEDGIPKIVDLRATIVRHDLLGDCIHLKNSIKGYEHFPLKSVSWFDAMKHGWWVCVGTSGISDSLYLHPMQVQNLYMQLIKCIDEKG